LVHTLSGLWADYFVAARNSKKSLLNGELRLKCAPSTVGWIAQSVEQRTENSVIGLLPTIKSAPPLLFLIALNLSFRLIFSQFL
jgi:hypothetical protein